MVFRELIRIITDLNELHSSLLDLAERKKTVLVRNEVDQLMQIVNQENRHIKRIGELDRERVDATGRFLMEKGYKPNPRVTVSDLAKIVFDPEDKKELLQGQKKLLDTIRKLRQANLLNQQLIEQSLAFIDYSLDIISGPPEDEAFYSNPTQASSGSKRTGYFDTRA